MSAEKSDLGEGKSPTFFQELEIASIEKMQTMKINNNWNDFISIKKLIMKFWNIEFFFPLKFKKVANSEVTENDLTFRRMSADNTSKQSTLAAPTQTTEDLPLLKDPNPKAEDIEDDEPVIENWND